MRTEKCWSKTKQQDFFVQRQQLESQTVWEGERSENYWSFKKGLKISLMAAILVDFDFLISFDGGRCFIFRRVCSGNISVKSPGT